MRPDTLRLTVFVLLGALIAGLTLTAVVQPAPLRSAGAGTTSPPLRHGISLRNGAEVLRAHGAPPPTYVADRDGMVLRFVGSVTAPGTTLNNNAYMWVEDRSGGFSYLPWREQRNIYPGNRFEVLESRPFDFSLGAEFFRVRRLEDGVVGFVMARTLFGEMVPAEPLWTAANRDYFTAADLNLTDGRRLHLAQQVGRQAVSEAIRVLSREEEPNPELTAGFGSAVHPLYSAGLAMSVAVLLLREGQADELHGPGLSALRRYFDRYVMPAAVTFPGGGMAWPYAFEFIPNWGVRLTPPWFSSYANAAIAFVSAMMHELTGEPRYADIARRAVDFIWERGSYQVDGFRHPAEYIYDFDVMPNIRVVDGELITIQYLFHTATLLRDVGILQRARSYGEALAVSLPYFTVPESGRPLFAAYVETALPPTYGWIKWVVLQALAHQMKDRTFLRFARLWRAGVDEGDCRRLAC